MLSECKSGILYNNSQLWVVHSSINMSINGSVQVYTVRFQPGQELKSSLEEFVNTHNLKAAFIMTCVGSVRRATLRFATPPSGRTFYGSSTSVSERVAVLDQENFEICSLVGTVSGNGSHLHTVLSRADGTTVGGHVVGSMEVQTTVEVVLGESLGETYSREYDHATGYKELVVKSRVD